MSETPIATVAHVIQLSVAPVFLLTAIGTILGVLNTRLSRIVDRGRLVADRLARLPNADGQPYRDELKLLVRRRHFVNAAIASGVCSALSVCLLIAIAFVGSIVRTDISRAVAVFFVGAMLGFVSALLCFLREIMLAVSRVGLGMEPLDLGAAGAPGRDAG